MGELVEQFVDKFRLANTAQTLLDATSFLRLVPEEVLTLGQLFLLALGALDGFEGIGVVARIPRLSGDRHGCGREVLNLFKLEVEMFGDDSQLGHIGLTASRMAGDEVGDDQIGRAHV